jgi:hypothetical protein
VTAAVKPTRATTAPEAALDLCRRWPSLAGPLAAAASTRSGAKVEVLVTGPTWGPVHDDTNLLSSAAGYQGLITAIGQLTTVGLTSATEFPTSVTQIAAQVSSLCAAMH